MKAGNIGILAGLLAAGALAAPLPSLAQGGEVKIIVVETAPPAAKPSPPPAPTKVGYVWSPGYWNWNGTAYVWTEGSWVAVVEAKTWVPPTWTKQDGKWYFTAGHWN